MRTDLSPLATPALARTPARRVHGVRSEPTNNDFTETRLRSQSTNNRGRNSRTKPTSCCAGFGPSFWQGQPPLVESAEEAERFAAEDPYTHAGLIKEHTIRPWRLIYSNPSLLAEPSE